MGGPPIYRKKFDKYGFKLLLMALPFFALVIMFCYVPIAGWGLAFFDYKPGMHFDKLNFVGFKYFALIGVYWKEILNALVNTLALSAMSLILAPLPAIFAIMLSAVRSPWLKKIHSKHCHIAQLYQLDYSLCHLLKHPCV